MEQIGLDELRKFLVDAQLTKNQKAFAYVRTGDGTALEQSAQEQAEIVDALAATKQCESPFVVFEEATASRPMFVPSVESAPAHERWKVADYRPRLLYLLSALRGIPNATLFVSHIDRLSRLVVEQEAIFHYLNYFSIKTYADQPKKLHITDGGYVEDVARMQMRMYSRLSTLYFYHSDDVLLAKGRAFKALNGGYVGGRPPFGYRAMNGELHIDEAQARIVRFIFQAYYKHVVHKTMENICAILNRKDSHHGVVYIGRKRKAAEREYFHKKRIYRILKNRELYLGYYTNAQGVREFRSSLKILSDEYADPRNLTHDPTEPEDFDP